jgi:hypothetical protein
MSSDKKNNQIEKPRTKRLELFISIVAIIFSGYTFWDNTFRAKIDVTPGKQVDLFVASNESGPMQPTIHMNISFTNSSGKTSFIDDIKLMVDFKEKGILLLRREFISFREIQNSIIDVSAISGVNVGTTEVSPIVVLGRTSVLKKYIFFPLELIEQSQIPNKFDLIIKIYIKQGGKWKFKNDFSISNNKNMWMDLNLLIHRSSIREIEFQD